MRYLVTGGGGFLGRHLVAQLQARGDDVRVFGRGDYPDLVAAGVELVRGRMEDPAVLDAACTGVDGIFHVAAKTGIAGRYADYERANLSGTRAFLAAALRNGVSRLVYTSTPSVVFGDAAIENGDESLPYPARYLTAYASTKAHAEAAVLTSDSPHLHTCALRPHLIWGPGDTNLLPRMVARARAGRLMQVGDGRNLVSVSYVENTAQAHLAAMDRLQEESSVPAHSLPVGERVGGRAFFVNEPEPVNCWAFINRLLGVCGVAPIRKRIPFRAAYAAGVMFEQVGRLRPDWEPPMTRFLALQLATSHYFRIDAAQKALRWQPRFTIEQGLERLRCEVERRGL